jgi:MtN3 and saliva related transmembrane protein
MHDYIQMVGLTAGLFTTASLLPQVVKSLRTKSTKDISLGMFTLIATGNLLWFVYGLLRRDIPIIAANLATFSFALIIILLKLKHK